MFQSLSTTQINTSTIRQDSELHLAMYRPPHAVLRDKTVYIQSLTLLVRSQDKLSGLQHCERKMRHFSVVGGRVYVAIRKLLISNYF